MRIPLSVQGLAVALLVGAVGCGAPPARAEPDTTAIQGRWKVVSEHMNGMDQRIKDGTEFAFSEDEVVITDRLTTVTYRYRMDPSKNPPQLHLALTVEGVTVVRRHIYRLRGNMLTMAWGAPNTPAPPRFTTRQGDRWLVAVLRRVGSAN